MANPPTAPKLEAKGVSKSFGPVQALDGVSLKVESGSIHAILGHNGAGKSTLVRMITGELHQDSGNLFLDSSPLIEDHWSRTHELGIGFVDQDYAFINDLTVAENLALGFEAHFVIDSAEEEKNASDVLTAMFEPLGKTVSCSSFPSDLSDGDRKLLQIARAYLAKPRILILDEPTTSLSESERRHLFDLIRRLKESGHTTIYVTHYIDEVVLLADAYTVLRKGRVVKTGKVRGTSSTELVALIAGQPLNQLYPRRSSSSGSRLPKFILEFLPRGRPNRPNRIRLAEGELLGLFGNADSGITELLRMAAGLLKPIDGKTWANANILCASRVAKPQFSFLSSDRVGENISQNFGIVENLTLPVVETYSRYQIIDEVRETRDACSVLEKLQIDFTRLSDPARTLSGGNQQKLAFGRLMLTSSDVLILDDPTKGVDITAKREIFQIIEEFRELGKAILWYTSYLEEFVHLAQSGHVFFRGSVSEKFEIDPEIRLDCAHAAATGLSSGRIRFESKNRE